MRLRLSVCFDTSRHNHTMVGVLSSKLGNRAGVHVKCKIPNFNRERVSMIPTKQLHGSFNWTTVPVLGSVSSLCNATNQRMITNEWSFSL